VSGVRVVGPLDPDLGWDGRALYDRSPAAGPGGPMPWSLRGSAGSVVTEHERVRIVRDPLGLNKLFWATDDRRRIVLASRPRRLVLDGVPFEAIRSVPRGAVVDVEADGRPPQQWSLVPERWSKPAADTADGPAPIAGRIRGALDGYLAALAAAHPHAEVYVCLSGGLDSSGIAALVRRHFPKSVAVSFDLRAPGRPASDDRRVAARLAADLGLPLLEADATESELLDHLDLVLCEGVDWRDFNVHAGLVNAVLAAAIDRARATDRTGPDPLVFTGDLANEFLVDYHSEEHGGRTFYALPRLAPAALRTALVQGLDTCHREIGVFGAWGLAVVQPYAVAVDHYLELPAAFLGREDRKQRLCESIFDGLLPRYVLDRPKVRAQVGSASGGGVLGLCVDRGLDGPALASRFASLHEVADPAALGRFLRAGRYRSAVPRPGGPVDARR
jgi:asparagine synthetase B (glutamine-hydrolysing)